MLLSTTKDLISPLLQAFSIKTFTFIHTTDSASELGNFTFSYPQADWRRKTLSRKSLWQVIQSEIAAATDEKSADLYSNELEDSHGVGSVFLEERIFNIS